MLVGTLDRAVSRLAIGGAPMLSPPTGVSWSRSPAKRSADRRNSASIRPTLDRVAADLVPRARYRSPLASLSAAANYSRRDGSAARRPCPPDRRRHGNAGDGHERACVGGGHRARRRYQRARCRRIAMPQVCESYSRQRARRTPRRRPRRIFAGGTGNPYFTTDTTAVLRAAEMGCDAVLKATNVDGVYSADPKRDPTGQAVRRPEPRRRRMARNLKVMDATAFALARENRMPIIVFSIRERGAIAAVLARQRARRPRWVDGRDEPSSAVRPRRARIYGDRGEG